MELADTLVQPQADLLGGIAVYVQIEMGNLLPDDPIGHGVNVIADDVAPGPIRLQERSPATHEGIGDTYVFEPVRPVKGVPQRALTEFRQDQCPKHGSRPSGEPLVDGD